MAFSGGDAAGGAAQGAAAGSMIMPGIGTAVGAVVGGVVGGVLGGKSRKAAKQAKRAQRRIAAMEAFRGKVAAQNSYEATRAEAVAGAATEGRTGDSAVQQALGSLSTQQNANFGYANAVTKQVSIVRKANAKAARFADYGQIANAAMGAAGSLFKGALTPSAAPAGGATDYIADQFNIKEPTAPSFFSQDSFQGPTFFSQQ